jgi:hypothetical protein
MLSSISEKKLRFVRAFLLAGWLLLIFSLFWDPYSHVLTDPASLFSPFAPWISAIEIQGVWVDQNPYPLGNRIFWTILVPLLPISFMVFGHEAWRRICPLSFVSQIPGYLRIRRWVYRVDRATGKRVGMVPVISRNSWLAKNALWVQLGLLTLGLCMRLWFANSDRTGLAIMLLGIIACAFVVGILWGGKTWCHYFCPVGVVQRIYTEPSGLLDSKPHIRIASLPQSMCRNPGKVGDISACVGCTSSCPDIDLEKSYWDHLKHHGAQLKSIYFGFLGLIWGFYIYFYLYSENWLYYFSGIWSHEEDPFGQLMGPGLYIDDTPIALPKLFAVPLVLISFALLGMFLGSVASKLYMRTRQKWNPTISQATLTHQVLIFTAYLSVNSFYIFGGRPTLLNLPAPIAGLISLLVVSLTTLWLMKAMKRSEIGYQNEGLSQVFIRQFKSMQSEVAAFLGGRKLNELSADEICILATAPGLQSDQQRLASYRELLEEFSKDSAPQLLSTIRDAQLRLRISAAEHQFIIRELQIFLPYGGDRDSEDDGRILSLLAFRQALLAQAQEHRATISKAYLDNAQYQEGIASLRGIYGVSDQEWSILYEQLTSSGDQETKVLVARIEELADIAAVKLLLRSHRGRSQQWDLASQVLQRELAASGKQVVRRLLAILLATGNKDGLGQYAQRIGSLSGEILEEVLQEGVPTQANRYWHEVLPIELLEYLMAESHVDANQTLEQLPSLHYLLGNQDRGLTQLASLISIGNDCTSALAFVLLNEVDEKQAHQLARVKLQHSNPAGYWLLSEAVNQPKDVSALSSMDKFLWLANTQLLGQVAVQRIAEIARQSESERFFKDSYIFREGDLPDAAIFLVEGQLQVVKASGAVLATLSPGVLTGELGILTGKPRVASLRVFSDSALIIQIEADDLNRLIERDSLVAASILKTVAGYI